MSFTSSDLDNIKTALTNGELTVSINGRTVTYKSNNDLIKAYNMIQTEINTTAGKASYSTAKFNV